MCAFMYVCMCVYVHTYVCVCPESRLVTVDMGSMLHNCVTNYCHQALTFGSRACLPHITETLHSSPVSPITLFPRPLATVLVGCSSV